MQYLLNLGNNKKSSPAKGQGHQTTGAPVINPHGLIFGTVDWSVLGHGAVDCGCGCLPKIETPDTSTTPPAKEVVKRAEVLKESSVVGRNDQPHSKQRQNKFRHVPKKHWQKLSG